MRSYVRTAQNNISRYVNEIFGTKSNCDLN